MVMCGACGRREISALTTAGRKGGHKTGAFFIVAAIIHCINVSSSNEG